jgi:RNA polymerase sigma factor (sigma-70 family)
MVVHARQDVAEVLAELLAYPVSMGKDQAWATFYELLGRRLAWIGTRLGLQPARIEDKIQDVFLTLLVRWQEYRPNRAKELLALACKLMHDGAVDELRRRNRRHVESLDELAVNPMDHGTDERGNLVEAETRRRWLDVQLKELNEEEEENCKLLRAHYLEDRLCKELAAETGHSVRAIEGRLARILQKLRRLAEKHPIDDGLSM